MQGSSAASVNSNYATVVFLSTGTLFTTGVLFSTGVTISTELHPQHVRHLARVGELEFGLEEWPLTLKTTPLLEAGQIKSLLNCSPEACYSDLTSDGIRYSSKPLRLLAADDRCLFA